MMMFNELCVLAALAGAPAMADGDPRIWLDRMADAVENLSYEGTFVHIIEDHSAETLRIVHKVTGDKVTERLISLDGSGREIIRIDDEVRCVLQGEKSVVVDRREQSPLLASLPVQREGLDEYYHFLLVGRDRVINRDVRVIEVRPRDEFRYGHKLWLDEATAMPLRTALINKNGRIVEQVLFTTIALDKSIPDEDLKPSLAAEDNYRWYVDDESDASEHSESGDTAWEADNLPRGFRLSVARAVGQGDSQNGKKHYVFTDGLASVSVFVEQIGNETPPLNGLSTMGSANAYATTVDGYQVTAVGEVPPSTVEMIGASLRRRQ